MTKEINYNFENKNQHHSYNSNRLPNREVKSILQHLGASKKVKRLSSCLEWRLSIISARNVIYESVMETNRLGIAMNLYDAPHLERGNKKRFVRAIHCTRNECSESSGQYS